MPKKKNRIIIDTNIWISFLLTHDYAKLDKILENKSVILLFSQALLDEFIEVVQRPKFKKYFSLLDLECLLLQIKDKAKFIEVTSEIKLSRDPKDDFLLSLAKDGKATYLITGDKDLLNIKSFERTMITTIADYLKE